MYFSFDVNRLTCTTRSTHGQDLFPVASNAVDALDLAAPVPKGTSK